MMDNTSDVDEAFLKPRKKRKQIVIGVLVIILLGLTVALASSYHTYKSHQSEEIINQLEIKVAEGELHEAKVDSSIKHPLTTVNPRRSFLNSSGDEVAYIDHQGNIGGIGNLSMTIGTGFFDYLGSSITRVTKGWFVDIDVSGNVNSTNVTSEEIYENGERVALNTSLSNYVSTSGDTMTGDLIFESTPDLVGDGLLDIYTTTGKSIALRIDDDGANLELSALGATKINFLNEVCDTYGCFSSLNSTYPVKNASNDILTGVLNCHNVTGTVSNVCALIGGNTTEEIQDAAWSVLTGTQTGITVTYQDASDNVDFVVTNAEQIYNHTNVLETSYKDFWYNHSTVLINDYGGNWYNHSSSLINTYGDNWYNHSSSLISQYGNFWYNFTNTIDFTNVAYLNNTQTFTAEQTFNGNATFNSKVNITDYNNLTIGNYATHDNGSCLIWESQGTQFMSWGCA